MGLLPLLSVIMQLRCEVNHKLDDTLDVFPAHGMGVLRDILTAVFADKVGLIHGEVTTFLFHMLAWLLWVCLLWRVISDV
jgi:ammonia channel protein AmtB